MTDLVITHLTHPLGPPWTLETLGDHWRPLATMPENGHFGHFGHFQAWSPILQEKSYSFCNDLVRYNSQLWETAALKF